MNLISAIQPKEIKMTRTYTYCVMDGNQDSHDWERPVSVHRSKNAATKAAEKLNASNPNYHYGPYQWAGSADQKQQRAAMLPA